MQIGIDIGIMFAFGGQDDRVVGQIGRNGGKRRRDAVPDADAIDGRANERGEGSASGGQLIDSMGPVQRVARPCIENLSRGFRSSLPRQSRQGGINRLRKKGWQSRPLASLSPFSSPRRQSFWEVTFQNPVVFDRPRAL